MLTVYGLNECGFLLNHRLTPNFSTPHLLKNIHKLEQDSGEKKMDSSHRQVAKAQSGSTLLSTSRSSKILRKEAQS